MLVIDPKTGACLVVHDLPGRPRWCVYDEPRSRFLDLSTDQEIARVRIAGEPDATWFSPAADRLYVATGDPGVIDVLDGETLSVVDEVATEQGAHTTALDNQRHRMCVFLPRSCQAAVYQESVSVA